MSTRNAQANNLAQPATRKNTVRAPAFRLPVFRSPIFLYRMGLGWMLGKRFMLLTHTGRCSGTLRRTILAVLRLDPKTKEIMAISAWSASDWYLNIQASPAVQVETGRTRYAPQQHTLSPEEIATLFVAYRDPHPIFSRTDCQMPGWKWNSSYEEFLELARTLRGIAFRPIS